MRDYIFNLLSESEFEQESNCINLMGIINDISLKVIEEDVENSKHEICYLKVAILQISCLERLYTDEKHHETSRIFEKDGQTYKRW